MADGRKRIIKGSDIRKAYLYLKKNGLKEAFFACLERLGNKNSNCYVKRELNDHEKERQRNTAWKEPVTFSILVPAYETEPGQFCEMIESVLGQTYDNWELIIADASPEDQLRDIVRGYGDDRVRYCRLDKNGGISENTNEALKAASGQYIGLLDHDDTLEADALFQVMSAIEDRVKCKRSRPKLLYTDEDKGDGQLNRYYEPHKKEEFNLDLILSNNYICHFLVMEAKLMKELGFRKEYDGAQDYDLILRAAACLLDEPDRIVHIPVVLYHWRCHTGSTAENPQSKMYAYEAGKCAVADFCRARGWNVKVVHTKHLGFYRVEYIPDIFSQRSDVAAVGGPLLHRGRIAGGALREDGTVLYEGLSVHFSGYMHKASLVQDVFAVDLKNCLVREELRGLCASVREQESDTGKAGILFGRRAKELGYRIVWDPQMKRQGD